MEKGSSVYLTTHISLSECAVFLCVCVCVCIYTRLMPCFCAYKIYRNWICAHHTLHKYPSIIDLMSLHFVVRIYMTY